MEHREDMTAAERQQWAQHLAEILTGPIPCSPPGQSKLGKRPPLAVWLARHFLRRLPWALSADELRQWERERDGDEYYAAQQSIVDARRFAEANLGDHFIGSAV